MRAQSIPERLAELGLQVPRIALPREDVDYTKWSVIACDQFTSDHGYWTSVEQTVGSGPSALHLILPEIYLEEPGLGERTEAILATMRRYLEEGVLQELEEGFVMVKRRTASGSVRTGLLAAIDLERYEYGARSTALIRATEGTIPERIPPRTTLRRGAPLELPHILVLYDDPEDRVLENVTRQVSGLKQLYDFELMMGGGHLTGYHIAAERMQEEILEGFESLADSERFARRYGTPHPLLFAVGDGNHSLAAAKTVWEEIKQTQNLSEDSEHPARHALVELVNIHDPGLEFEPIHRVVFGGSDRLRRYLQSKTQMRFIDAGSFETMRGLVDDQTHGQRIGLMRNERCSVVEVASPISSLAAGTLQDLLDEFLATNAGIRVDYIHGEQRARQLGSEGDNTGVFLPAISKSQFFQTIVRDGSFPRKTFSMGEAEEKRFYLEARRISADSPSSRGVSLRASRLQE